MSIRIVVDTNVFVSGIHWTGASEKVLRSWMLGECKLINSIPIIDEMVRVLQAFKVPLDPESISWWEGLVLERSYLVFPTLALNVVKNDPDDDKFIEAAFEGNAHYIISKDKHLLSLKEYGTIKIISPEEFLGHDQKKGP